MPSEIDSPTLGTVIGTAAIAQLTPCWRSRGRQATAPAVAETRCGTAGADGRLDDFGLLAVVDQLRAGGRAGAGVAADVLERRPQQLLEPRGDERPAAHVLRLLLHPDPLAGRPVALEHRLQLVGRPGIELLEADDGHLAWLPTSARAWRPGRSRPCPSRARRGGPGRAAAGSSSTSWKRPDGQVVDRRDRLLVPQQALGRHHDQRLAEARGGPGAAAGGSTAPASIGTATWMLSSAQSWRNRSSRALECSGPCPS